MSENIQGVEAPFFLSKNSITFMLSSLFNPKRVRNVMPWTAESNEGSNYASCARFCDLTRLYHAIC